MSEPGEGSGWVAEARAALAAPTWRERFLKLVEFRPRELVALALLAAAVVAGAGVAFVRALPRSAPPAPALAEPSSSTAASASPTPGVIVHVAGAVSRPGVYSLAGGSRVIDAVTAAGGPTSAADLERLNLARPVADGERLYVPRRGEEVPPEPAGGPGGAGGGSGSGPAAGGKVNINTATLAELDALPGVGPVTAQRIVDYRTKHGPFRDVRDLLKVEGIGERKFASLKDLVTV